ncbi:MAG: hypothetical protein AB4060_13755 [Crocosphaera sp.]
MNSQDLVGYLNELIFSSTGKHISSLQVAILKGVLKGQKYANIADDYNCSKGHVKDEAYKLWQLLSKTLGEDINKSNFRATVERMTAKKIRGIGNIAQVNKLNFCSNYSTDIEENDDIINDDKIMVEAIEKKTKRNMIPRLVKLGLSAEQIAEALELNIQEVDKIMASLK